MADLVDKVFMGIVFSPSGEQFRTVSGTVPRSMGTRPDVASVIIKADSRFKKALEFDGAFIPHTPGSFTRTVLPPAGAGKELSSVGWKIYCKHETEGFVFVEPLILTEATVVKYSRAQSSVGKFVPDSGEDRIEFWQLALADTRLLWRAMGHISGRRNYVDANLDTAAFISFPQQKLKIAPPTVKFQTVGETSAVVMEPGSPVEVPVPAINGLFDPLTLLAQKNGSVRLRTAKELLEEVLQRVPHLVPFDGALFGPADVAGELEKIRPTDIDYGQGSPPERALNAIAEKTGLVIGMDFEGRAVVEFDALPSAAHLGSSGVLSRQGRWTTEDRGSRVTPRAPGARFYPARVIKQVVLSGFEPAAKLSDGTTVELEAVSGALGFAGKEGEIALAMALKGEVERSGEVDRLEKVLRPKPGSGETASVDERIKRAENIRILADNAFRTFKWSPEPGLRFVAAAARAKAKEARESFTKSPSKLPTERERNSATAKFTLQTFNAEGALDGLLAKPLRQVTKVEGVGVLKPRFVADIPLHRLYDFFQHAEAISGSSFRGTQTVSPTLIDLGFDQKLFDERVRQTQYFGSPASAPAGFDPTAESFVRAPGTCPRITGRTFGPRAPSDWPEGNAKTETLQARFRQLLGKSDGTFPENVKNSSDFVVWDFFQQFLTVVTGRNPVPLEVFVTWISGDASEWVDSWDPDSGIVRFKTPMGLYLGTSTFRKVLEDSEAYLRAVVESVEKTLLSFSPQQKPPTSQTTVAWLLAWAMDIILDDDSAGVKLAKKIHEDSKGSEDSAGAAQSLLAALAGSVGGLASVGLGIAAGGGGKKGLNPADFRGILRKAAARSPGFPLWQIAPLRHGIEKDLKNTANALQGKDPAGNLKVPQGGAPPELSVPASGGNIGSSTPNVSASGGDIGVSVPVSAPSAGDSPGGFTGSAVVSGGGSGATVAEPAQSLVPMTTSETTVEKAKEKTDGAPGGLIPTPVYAVVWLEARYEESIWPFVQFGDPAPSTIERLDVPWVEDLDGKVINSGAVIDAAQRRWAEMNSDSTVEESQEIEVASIFQVKIGSVVRSAAFSWEEGGRNPNTRVTCSALGTRAFPFLRASALNERVGIERR